MKSSFWKHKRVLVTGAGGFIGSHVAEALLECGARVRALVRYNSRNSWGQLEDLPRALLRRCEVVLGDVRDGSACREYVRGCEYVFHLAALIAVPYSYRSPLSYEETNVRGTLNLLEACRAEKIRRFLHTSSSEVYGTAVEVPIRESHPLQGQSPYAASKIAADQFVESYYRSFDLPVTIARPFNTFGPRQSARAIIPTIIVQALKGGPIGLGAREPVRDFMYVGDTVRGLLTLARCNDTIGRIINLGTGKGVSIGDLARRIVAIVGGSLSIKHEARRLRPAQSEVMRLICDASLARELAGWKPAASLDQGLRRTVAWIRKHLSEYKADMYVV